MSSPNEPETARSTMYARKRREQGLCWQCSNPPEPGHTQCAKHLEKGRQRVRKRYQRKVQALGSTACSICFIRPPKENLKTCQQCLDRIKEWGNKRTHAGRCRCCDLPPEPNRVHCAACLKRLCLAVKEKRCGGQWDITLARDNQECRLCGTGEKLVVHHIDGTGKGRRGPVNNAPENLVTLCSRCHVCLETLLHRYKDMELLFRLAHRLPLDQALE